MLNTSVNLWPTLNIDSRWRGGHYCEQLVPPGMKQNMEGKGAS
jgi:hypothetical protein